MNTDDPAAMAIEERIEVVAAILAAGFLRLTRSTGGLHTVDRLDPCPQRGAPASESAAGSKTPSKPPCHLSETSPSCAPC